MAVPTYQSLTTLVAQIDVPARHACEALLTGLRSRFPDAPGSARAHQAWPGGYYDHLAEVMNTAVVLYDTLGGRRPLPFTLSDALLVLFLHDLEKPWKYEGGVAFASKAERAAWRTARIDAVGLTLTSDQQNALRYVEGEGDDYRPGERVLGPLAAFCHTCDVLSARLWPEHPASAGDPWSGAGRQGAAG